VAKASTPVAGPVLTGVPLGHALVSAGVTVSPAPGSVTVAPLAWLRVAGAVTVIPVPR
jgi:hypothetical protein